MRKLSLRLIAVLLLTYGFGSSLAQNTFPERDIRLVVPYAPGGQSDITARLLADVIRQHNLLPVNLLVTNIDGASAGAGMLEVRDAQPDGYTLLHHHTSLITHELLEVRDWGFEAFTPVAMLFESPAAVVVHPDSPYYTLQDVAEAARENPDQLTWNVSSIGGGAHLASEVVMGELGIQDQVRLVAYGSGGPATRAILAGEDDVSGNILAQIIDHVAEGRLRMIAVGTAQRMADFPDVPTFAEEGIDSPLRVSHRMGIWAPPGTPDDVVQALYEVIAQAVETEEWQRGAAALGIDTVLGDGAALYDHFVEDRDAIAVAIEELGLDQ